MKMGFAISKMTLDRLLGLFGGLADIFMSAKLRWGRLLTERSRFCQRLILSSKNESDIWTKRGGDRCLLIRWSGKARSINESIDSEDGSFVLHSNSQRSHHIYYLD